MDTIALLESLRIELKLKIDSIIDEAIQRVNGNVSKLCFYE